MLREIQVWGYRNNQELYLLLVNSSKKWTKLVNKWYELWELKTLPKEYISVTNIVIFSKI